MSQLSWYSFLVCGVVLTAAVPPDYGAFGACAPTLLLVTVRLVLAKPLRAADIRLRTRWWGELAHLSFAYSDYWGWFSGGAAIGVLVAVPIGVSFGAVPVALELAVLPPALAFTGAALFLPTAARREEMDAESAAAQAPAPKMPDAVQSPTLLGWLKQSGGLLLFLVGVVALVLVVLDGADDVSAGRATLAALVAAPFVWGWRLILFLMAIGLLLSLGRVLLAILAEFAMPLLGLAAFVFLVRACF